MPIKQNTLTVTEPVILYSISLNDICDTSVTVDNTLPKIKLLFVSSVDKYKELKGLKILTPERTIKIAKIQKFVLDRG